ncbi:MAG: hypothetical protein HY870_09440, partial [Chloroflexi bacterium]|nr:hypothetical protein [Chloroflexota bacterium]
MRTLARLGSISIGLIVLAACTISPPVVSNPNLDAETQTMIAQAQRVVFVVPFSHWDTDWHDTFDNYVKLADGNILAALQLAKQSPRFRYAVEQVLFAQHFWDNHPQYRADFESAVQQRQITFAWAGITQPETSLVAPSIQEHNLQLGQAWISATFGSEYVPHVAWQSDAFGNSAAFPLFLSNANIPYLFIGRSTRRCVPDDPNCQPLPQAFYWQSPASMARVLVTYISYPMAWDAIHRLATAAEQSAALRTVVDDQFKRTTSKYLFLPMGSDFIDPMSNLPTLVDEWNAADHSTVLVMVDPETAFQYLATQNLPEYIVDLNPVWQAFYASRPYAKIADKEADYYLNAADRFGATIGAASSMAWYTATVNAHYDNIGAVSFDAVWNSSQRPRFEQTVAIAAHDLAAILAQIASKVDRPLLIFNPSTWARSGVVEIDATAPNLAGLPVQRIDPHTVAIAVNGVPPIGSLAPIDSAAVIAHSALASPSAGNVTLANGLITVTLNANRGGAFSAVQVADKNLLDGFGDDVVYLDDSGDIYGARFGQERARESATTASLIVLANGPLLARAQAVFTLGDQPLTKTVTVRADDPTIEVTLELKALPETTAIVQTPTIISTTTRTDDLGFTAFEHPIDNRPIISGDITYRRAIFYPIVYWSDVSTSNLGLSLITHGLQGLGGTQMLSLMLVRDVTRDEEGVTDRAYHTLRYAYVPHLGKVQVGDISRR